MVLNSRIPLGMLDAAFPEGCLCRCDGGFMYQAGGRCDWLTVGKRVRWGAVTWNVEEFRPRGL